jgi:alpha-glucosidase
MPYLYSLYRRAAEVGEPMLRTLFYEFESDPRAFADSDDFMLGPSLLVANVVARGQRERRVYLPALEHGWYDFHSGTHHHGGGEVVVSAPLDHIPLFAPAGAMIPMTGTDDFTRLHDEPSRCLRVFPMRGEAHASFVLYEDDGISLRYRKGDFAEVAFALQTTATDIDLTARVTGAYQLPYREIEIGLPRNEHRRISLRGEGIELRRFA